MLLDRLESADLGVFRVCTGAYMHYQIMGKSNDRGSDRARKSVQNFLGFQLRLEKRMLVCYWRKSAAAAAFKMKNSSDQGENLTK